MTDHTGTLTRTVAVMDVLRHDGSIVEDWPPEGPARYTLYDHERRPLRAWLTAIRTARDACVVDRATSTKTTVVWRLPDAEQCP